MYFKPKTAHKSVRGWTLVEMMVAVAIFSISAMALTTVFVFTIRSTAAAANYSDLDKENRFAMDRLTREIREAKKVTAYSENSMTILDGSGNSITYTFDKTSQQMIRSGPEGTRALLQNCNLLKFRAFMRPPESGSFDTFSVATNNWQQTVKGVQLTWKTSRMVSGTPLINSENVQTALIVIRKQQD